MPSLNICKKNQKSKINPKTGIIYIIRSTKDINGIYRNGKTIKFKQHILHRQRSHTNVLEILYDHETDFIDQVKSCLKTSLKHVQYKKRKEFCQVDFDLIKKTLNSCEKIQSKLINKPTKKLQNERYYIYTKIIQII